MNNILNTVLTKMNSQTNNSNLFVKKCFFTSNELRQDCFISFGNKQGNSSEKQTDNISSKEKTRNTLNNYVGRLSSELQNKICDAYVAGNTLACIAEKVGCSITTVSAILEGHDIQRRNCGRISDNYRFINQNDKEDAVMDELTSMLEETENGRVVLAYPGSNRFDAKTQSKICKEYKSGVSLLDLGYKYFSSAATIRNILVQNNVEIRCGRFKLTEDEHKKVCAKYKAGESLAHLAKEYHCSASTILSLLNKEGIQCHRMQNRKNFTPEVMSEICSGYANGKSIMTLALTHGCSTFKIKSVLTQQGVYRPCTKKQKLIDVKDGNVCDEYKNGASLLILAKKYGISVTTIRNILIKNNVKMRTKNSENKD